MRGRRAEWPRERERERAEGRVAVAEVRGRGERIGQSESAE